MKKNIFMKACMACLFLLALNACNQQEKIPFGDAGIEQKVDSVLKMMTLDEKIGQLNQYNGSWDMTGPMPEDAGNRDKYNDITNGHVGSMLNVLGVESTREAQKLAVENTRLGIPLIFGHDVIHGYKTTFPVPLAEAASWDLEAIEKGARVAAIEASAAGLHWTFAPMVDICRDPRWGRVMEGAGEDPYLASLIAAARVKGFQGDDLSSPGTLAACAKHFAGYGAPEGGRDYNAVEISRHTLHNIYLPPFKACVDQGVTTFMNGFNTLNGIPVTGNQFLVRDILKGKWDFKGFVVSDWNSIGELQAHGTAANKKEAAKIALLGGTDMDMETRGFLEHVKELVENGEVMEKHIDDAVRRILRVKFALGLFDDPYRYCSEEREEELLGHPDHREAALEMALKSIVLLKNNNNTLPLPKGQKKIALVGPVAADKDIPLGSWRSQGGTNTAVSLLEGMEALNGKPVVYAEGCKLTEQTSASFLKKIIVNEIDKSGFSQAIAISRQADVIVAAVGEHAYMAGEARSRARIDLPGVQLDLLKALHATGKPLIVVLFNGRPLTIPWVAEHADAIVEAWQLGVESGNAIAKVLFGDYNPSGRLPVTFPRSVGQIPLYYNHLMTGRPKLDKETIFVSRYIDESNQALYPFGFGLSYTGFAYSDFALSKEKMALDDSLEVRVTVKNTGNLQGTETVQCYTRDLVATYSRPVLELKAFQQVSLAPGQSKTINFWLTTDDLSYFNRQGEKVIEPGRFDVLVGKNSSELEKKTVELTNQ